MIKTSVVALLSAALFVAAAAVAQDVSVDVSTSASAEVSVSTPDVSSTLSSISSELSSAVSSVSSEVSSTVSSVSSELSSSSMSGPSSEPMVMNCGTGPSDLDISAMMFGAPDEAALAAVTSVTVVTIGDCEGLTTIDGTAQATLSTHPAVIAALAAAGEASSEIVAYTLADGSLTVFVRAE